MRNSTFVFHSNVTTGSQTTSTCRKCDDLERQYQRTVDEIYSVLRTRFPAVCEKVLELRKWQDIRNNAIEAFHEHKKSHIRRAAEPERQMRHKIYPVAEDFSRSMNS